MNLITRVPFERQLGENPDLQNTAIDSLRAWNMRQAHLPELPDADLALFYLTNSCQLLCTENHINKYFIMRHYIRKFFARFEDFHSNNFKQALDTLLVTTLPRRTKDNNKVIFAKLTDFDPVKYNFENCMRLMNMVIDSGVYEDGPDNKYVFIFDLDGATVDHFNSMDWLDMRKLYEYIRQGSIVRWMGGHYINTKVNTEFHNLIKCYIEANFPDSQTVRFHSNVKSLINSTGIEVSMLPNEMGGDAGPVLELQKNQVERLKFLYFYYSDLENRIRLKDTNDIPSDLEVFELDYDIDTFE